MPIEYLCSLDSFAKLTRLLDLGFNFSEEFLNTSLA